MESNSPPRRFYFGKINRMSNLGNYLRDTMAELKQVSWPTQKQAFLYTVLVIVISVFVSLFLGAFDFVFTRGIEAIVSTI
jgi:preprotein translocase subunit SecE